MWREDTFSQRKKANRAGGGGWTRFEIGGLAV